MELFSDHYIIASFAMNFLFHSSDEKKKNSMLSLNLCIEKYDEKSKSLSASEYFHY